MPLPLTQIAAVVEGQLARVAGVIGAGPELLVAPLSGQPCVLYELRVVQLHNHGLAYAPWMTTEREVWSTRDARAFVLVDDSGRALVDPARWTTDLRAGLEVDVAEPLPGWPAAADRLLRAGLPLRAVERVLVPGARASITATAIFEPDPDGAARATAGYRGAAPTRVVLTGTSREPLAISTR